MEINTINWMGKRKKNMITDEKKTGKEEKQKTVDQEIQKIKE